jgi:homospermidine synthase
MAASRKDPVFGGRLLMVGFGCIGQGVLPLLLRHIDMRPDQVHIVSADAEGRAVAQGCGAALQVAPLTRDNLRKLLGPRLSTGDLPFDEVLSQCRPYLGEVVGVLGDWTPLQGRGHLFREEVDAGDPWQFINFRVT